MPISGQWWTLSETLVETENDSEGVYELGDKDGEIVYVGRSYTIKSRLKRHISSPTTCIKNNATKYRVEYTTDSVEREKELYWEYADSHNGKGPKCNEKELPRPE